MTFRAFFSALWDGHQPFPWQEKLVEQVAIRGWPKGVGLPTAAGKTALIDIAVFALAQGAEAAARRIFFVVDRRVIVDEAAERANEIAERLANAVPESPVGQVAEALRKAGADPKRPLATSILRGGIPRDDSWAESPLQPAVICSTVDQIGSALLFRAYGTSEYARPIRAGLAAFDSLLILDEAHTSQPFAQTLERIQQYTAWAGRQVARPLQVVEMSATPRTTDVLRETTEDREHKTLRPRWYAEKRAELVVADALDGESAEAGGFTGLVQKLVKEALRMREEHGAQVVGVIANRVRTARAVHAALLERDPERTILLTGRARPWDRDQTWKKWQASIALGRPAGQPEQLVFVVATQCIEAGANLDFDALVTEAASVDALEQRFGRLNRGGKPVVSRAAIVAQKDQTTSRYVDGVYGKALAATWAWLKKREVSATTEVAVPPEGKKKPKVRKVKERWVPMGAVALRDALEETPNRGELAMDRPSAPVLMPAHMDLLCQTSPEPALSPEPSVFLHGPESGPADVQVVWRADLDADSDRWAEAVALCPPSAAEAIGIPVWAARSWLRRAQGRDIADVEGVAEPTVRENGVSRTALCWRGPDESFVVEAAQVRPGMTLVVPSSYGGCDGWGWNPASETPVRDVGDAVKLRMGRPLLRLHEELAEVWGYPALAEQLRNAEITTIEVLEALRAATAPEGVVRDIVEALLASSIRVVPGAAIVGKAWFEQGSARSSHTAKEQGLAEHVAGCEAFAGRLAAAVEADLRQSITRAAELHDAGKADSRFQAWLRGGNPIRPLELIAKSARSGQNSRAIERARKLAGYPKGARHELTSVALMNGTESDLVLHLIASHHGRCRPFPPCVPDDNPVEVQYQDRTARSDHGLERAGAGIATRFWRLTRKYGWYGLAYLEALLRLADHRQSEAECDNGGGTAHA
jgi:CRISPR-associated endonuclease/helicase Cas3